MLNSTPNASELWHGISGHFENLSQVLCEFLDNSISNIISSNSLSRTILICIFREGRSYKISIEDAGSGIVDFEPVMRLGDKSAQVTPLNEHGFGLKHALATANPSNDNWKIFTRTQNDLNNNQFRGINADYDFEYEETVYNCTADKWLGRLSGTGTYVEFIISDELFNTVQSGIPGNAGYETCIKYLSQDLGYIYSGILNQNAVNIVIISDGLSSNLNVEAIQPEWVDFYQTPSPGEVTLDLGDGNVTIKYRFGEMKEGTSVRYYKRNMSSSGVEIRVNGRLIMDNLFNEIWGMEIHPSYNHFLGQIDIISLFPARLPKTKTSKNGIRKEDHKLSKLISWIKSIYPKPERKLTNAISEVEFIEELANIKRTHIRTEAKRIETNFTVFNNINSPVKVDLYLYDGNEIVIYEAKKKTADVQDFYQLLMYWDGLVSDGINPSEGILLAPDFSPGVDNIIDTFNGVTDREGNRYNFTKKTWIQEGINYPER